MKQKIIKELQMIVDKMGVESTIELTEAKGHADFATNIALKIAGKLGKSPIEIATMIAGEIKLDIVEKVDVAGPGFINIFIKPESIGETIKEVISKEDVYGKGNQGKKINIEYISANPTGFLHVGHARNACLGETVASVLEFSGNKVVREYWINDAGSQIDILAKSLYIRYQNLFDNEISLPENSYKGNDIIEFAEEVKNNVGNKYVGATFEGVRIDFREIGTKIALDNIKKHISALRIHMDIWTSETDVRASGDVENYIQALSDTFEEDGALWLRTTDHGDDKDRVIRKSDGDYTYFAPDIAYHNIKYDRGYDKLINIWGGDHIGYIQRIKTSLKLSGQDPDKLDVLTIQMVKLLRNNEELKMSKRMGTAVTIADLIDMIGPDAVRYYMIDKSNNTSVTIDVDEVQKKTNDNPLFAIQYVHARATQLIEKATEDYEVGEYSDQKEIDIINHLAKFPQLVEDISKNYKVHLLTKYTLELAKLFNSFYSNSDKVIGNIREAELIALVKAVRIVLRNASRLIGISMPDKI